MYCRRPPASAGQPKEGFAASQFPKLAYNIRVQTAEAKSLESLYMRHRLTISFAVIILLSSILVGFLEGGPADPPLSPGAPPELFLERFTEALDVIQHNYATDVSSQKLVYSAISTMLHRLDPHSNFYDPVEYARMREEQQSRFFGLGIHVRPLQIGEGRVVIAAPPEEGTPAHRSGLRAGDVITRIDGQAIDAWTVDEVINHLRGPRRTAVNVTIERPGAEKPLEFSVVRDEVPLNAIPHAFEIEPGIGYIKLERFADSTTDEFEQKLKELDPDRLSGLILDLRDNPGGLLNRAVEVADFFVPRGDLIVSTRGRLAGSAQSFKARGRKKIQVPLIVLINRGSASASEVVAGALQDHDRALIVGETSFGKGLVQTLYPIGNDTGLALTTARYYTPSGRLIQRKYDESAMKYYYIGRDDAAQTASNTEGREVWRTDSGRIVYGGGGITPDVIEHAQELNRFEALLASKDILFQFARRLILKEDPGRSRIKTGSEIQITDAVMSEFQEFMRERRIAFAAEDIRDNSEYIKRGIRQHLATSLEGMREGYKIQVRGDALVLKALDLMPQAKALAARKEENAGVSGGRIFRGGGKQQGESAASR